MDMIISHVIIDMYNPPLSLIFPISSKYFVLDKPFTYKINIA